MEKVIFSYEGQQIPIVCNTKDFFADIVKRFKTKIRNHKNNLYFVKDAREVPEDATYEMLCNPFDRQNKTIQVLVFEKEININDNMNNMYKSYNNFSSFSPNTQISKNNSLNRNYNINSVISKMQNEINQLKEELRLSKFYQNTQFTRGMIIAWSGNIHQIPKGWALCDGTNQTPDLRNRFILGASQQIPFGTFGGNNSIKLEKTNLPPIGESFFSADSHYGSYHHSDNGFLRYLGCYSTYIKKGKDDDWGSNWKIDLNTGFNATPIDIMNPFVSLFYIMKL